MRNTQFRKTQSSSKRFFVFLTDCVFFLFGNKKHRKKKVTQKQTHAKMEEEQGHKTPLTFQKLMQEFNQMKIVKGRELFETEELDMEKVKKWLELVEHRRYDIDSVALLALAKCCALGTEIEQSPERARALISKSVKKGNKQAERWMKLINGWKGKKSRQTFSFVNGL